MRSLVACANGGTSKVSNVVAALTSHTPFPQRHLGHSRSNVLPARILDEICQMIGTASAELTSEKFHYAVRKSY